MPELPEVETIVGQLAPFLPGLRIAGVEIAHADLLREPPDSFERSLIGRRFLSVTRRGKNLVFQLTGPQILLTNLGMTGQILLDAGAKGLQLPSLPALSFRLLPRGTLHYCDMRRFGRWLRMSPGDWEQESRRLGPEPLDPDLTDDLFFKRTSASRSPVRSWLLDQTHIAGIGNIYANEALFRARIHPSRPARSMSEVESSVLLAAIREVLREAIEARGTTLRDYRTAEGDRGSFEPSLQIYGREGLPCTRCGEAVVRIVFGNRSAFHCPACQKEKPPYAS